MKSLDDLLVVNLNDSAAAWCLRLEGQHGELAMGLALPVGSQETLQIPSHYVVCMNDQPCCILKKNLISE